MNELALTESFSLRQEFCKDENLSVLEKVGELILLQGGEFGTIKQVADFYKVPIETIKTVVRRHNREIRKDGYKVIQAKGFEKFHNETLEIPNRGLAIFPRRAILRIGCLLRDSPIAQQVRSYLLNIEENLTPQSEQTLKYLVDQLDQHAVQLIENADGLKSQAEQLHSQTRMIKAIVDEIYLNRNRIGNAENKIQEHDHRILALEKLSEEPQEKDPYIISEQIAILKERVKVKGNPCRIWSKLKSHFGITRYIFLPRDRFREALDWLESHSFE